jgi:hypothetical protein
MTDFTSNSATEHETFYDMSEVREAMNDPRYRSSARYRDEVAIKLQRSQQAGTVASQASYHHRTNTRAPTRTVTNEGEVQGLGKPAASQPFWAEASRVNQPGSVFTTIEATAAAMGAPQFDIDPTYREAVREKIARSIREGYLDANLNPTGKGQ